MRPRKNCLTISPGQFQRPPCGRSHMDILGVRMDSREVCNDNDEKYNDYDDKCNDCDDIYNDNDDKYNDNDENYLRVGHHGQVWRVKLVST